MEMVLVLGAVAKVFPHIFVISGLTSLASDLYTLNILRHLLKLLFSVFLENLMPGEQFFSGHISELIVCIVYLI
jgi:hypothetical protein